MRFASAAELHQLLVEGEESEWWAEREAVLKAQTPVPTIGIRRESAVFGREAELGALREAWEHAKAGRGSTILVEGEPGIGRTRLIDAFLQSLATEDAHLLFGSYPPSGGLGGFSESIVGKFGRAGLEEALAPYLTVTPTLVPGFVSLLRHESAPTGSAPLQGDALQAVACHLMHALAEERPTVWCLDDIHFAPEESRQLVLALASALADHPVLLILTSRPDLDMPHLSRLENFRRLPLGRLSPRQVIEVLRDALKSETLAEKLGGKIAYKSDGVPMFVFEMVRSLKEGSLLRRMPDGTYVQSEAITDIQVPSAVRDLIGNRLKSLEDDDRNLLDAASVEGYEFDPDLVARVTETKSIKVLQRLASLERKSGIVRAAGAKYRFDHHQIHEVLYAELSEALKKGYHGLLAEAYAEREGLADLEPEKVPGDKAAFVAMHHLRSMTPRAALPYVDGARKHLSGAFRNEVFLQMAELALPVVEGEDKLKLLQAMGSVHQHLGEVDEADALLHQALVLADELGDHKLRVEARNGLSFFYWSTGTFDKAEEITREAEAIARETGDEELEKTVRARLGLVFASLGHHAKALDYEVSANNRGLSLQYLGRLGEALEHFETRLASAQEGGQPVGKGIALVNLGRLYAMLGDLDKGRATLEESRSILRSVGARRPESYALHRLGMVLEQAGDLDEAEKVHQAAIAMRREMRYPYGLSRSLARLGAMRVNQGRPDEARALLEEAYELAKETGIPDPVVMAAAYLTRVGGDPQTALDAFAEYDGRLRAADEMEARFVLWEATGDRDHLDAAHRLLVYARDHAPEDRREAMIANVPLHRKIAAAGGPRAS